MEAHATRARAEEDGNLDFLRSVAVLMVLAFHVLLAVTHHQRPTRGIAAALWQMGHWAVLLFFVHTCYVLMLSLERQSRRIREGDSPFWPFLVRRAFRLLPLSVTAVILVALFRLPVANVRPFRAASLTPADVLANVFLIQNVTHQESVIATLWSLPYEAQMYLVLPGLFLMARWTRSPWPLLALWVACVEAARLYLGPFGGLYDMPLYVPCFLAGVIGFKRLATTTARWPFWGWAVSVLLISAAYLAHPTHGASWAACLAVGWLIPMFASWPEGISRTACRLVSRYSYGIYLFHFLALWIAFTLISASVAVQVAAFLVLTAAISVAAYHLIEAPMIEVGRRIAAQRYVVRADGLGAQQSVRQAMGRP